MVVVVLVLLVQRLQQLLGLRRQAHTHCKVRRGAAKRGTNVQRPAGGGEQGDQRLAQQPHRP